jgi:hypothetical protein
MRIKAIGTKNPFSIPSTGNHKFGTKSPTLVLQQQPHLSHLSSAPLQEVVIIDQVHKSAEDRAQEILKESTLTTTVTMF